MPSRRAHRIKPDRRRMLELLAASRDRCTESILLAHGFSVPQMVEIINAGLATATAERVVAGSRKVEVARVRITEAGRRALERMRR
jgi:hypothetical protein